MVEGCLRQSVAHTEVTTVHRVAARYCFLLIVVICGLSVSSVATANDIATLKAEAERGDSEAQALLRDRFWFGIGIASDSRKAMKWYRKAAVDLPAVIYDSPYYGFETKPHLFFDLRRGFLEVQWKAFRTWWEAWQGKES